MKKIYAITRILNCRHLLLMLSICSFHVLSAQDFASSSQVIKNGNAQRTDSRTSKEVTLENFLNQFEQKYHIYFSYQTEALKKVQLVYDQAAKDEKNPEITLKKVLATGGLSYKKVNNVFIIKLINKPQAEINKIVNVPVAFVVNGTVRHNTGLLSGVTITEKGTSNATSTNDDGKFTLTVSGSDAILVLSFIGYKTTEVPVNGRSQITISMEPGSAEELSNVIVTALGISRSKRSLAYSVGEVKNEDLVKAGNPNALKSLDGKVSGVNLTNLSSDPTSSVLVNIRGTTTMPSLSSGADISSRSQPLYVIDGIPVGTQTFTPKDGVDFGNILSQLNPEDIDNITILKGGSAGALYGAEGGNGVVMITTKSGRGAKKGIGVSFTSTGTWEQPYQFIKEQQEYGQGERAFEWQYDNTDTWGPKLDGKFTSNYWDVKAKQWKSGPMLSSGEDRVKAYLRTGNTLSNNISVTGNYDKGAFRLSLSNMTNKGVMPNTKTDQKSISLNTEYRITNNIKVSVSTSYIHTYSPNKANTTGSNSIMNALLFNFPSNLQRLDDMRDYWLTGYEGIQQNGAIMRDNGLDVSSDNPWWTTYEKLHRFGRDNYFGKLQLDWRLSSDFSLLLRTGMESVKENYELRQSWGKTNMNDKFRNGDGLFVTGNNNFLIANSDAILTYNKNLNKFSISASVGANYAYTSNDNLEMTAGRLSTPALFTLGNAMPGQLSVSSSGWGTGQSYSVYGTATLGFADQLYVDVTGRNDWKGILSEQKINYFYPSTSVSWIASETFAFPKVFNLVKARLAWADVGNGLTRRRSIDTYSYDASDWGAVKTVSINASLVDPNIKAMHSVTKEAGVDVALLDNMVRFDFTYFIKDQKDQIDNIPTVQGTGYSGMLTNIGDVRSKGFEWGLNVNPLRTKDWNWDVSASFTKYKATITRLSDKFAPNGYVFANYDGKTRVKIAVGEEIGNIYEQNPILKVKSGKYAGTYLLDNEGGEFQISGDERDRAMLGNFNPDYILGLNTTLRYKQFALNLVGSLRKGGQYISVNQQYLESNGRAFTTLGSGPNNPWWMGGRDAEHGGLPWPTANSSVFDAINNNNDGQRSDFNDASYAKGVFINPNYTGNNPSDADYIVNGADPKNTFYQIPYNSYGDVIWDFSSTRTFDATNFKMREISLAYTVPMKLAGKYKLNNLTFSLIGRNVFQWNKSGRHEDPESAFTGVGSNQGVLRATLPSIRSYGFRLSVNF